MRIVHNIQHDDTFEYMGRSMPRIYVSLDNKQVEYQSHMIEVEGNIDNQTIVISIDSRDRDGYIDPNVVEIFHLKRRKHGKYSLVQLETLDKRRINELIKDCPMDMNGLRTKVDLKIIPLGSYNCLMGINLLDKHHVFLEGYSKVFTYLYEEGNWRTVQVLPREILIK
jgi:hypothetical protein